MKTYMVLIGFIMSVFLHSIKCAGHKTALLYYGNQQEQPNFSNGNSIELSFGLRQYLIQKASLLVKHKVKHSLLRNTLIQERCPIICNLRHSSYYYDPLTAKCRKFNWYQSVKRFAAEKFSLSGVSPKKPRSGIGNFAAICGVETPLSKFERRLSALFLNTQNTVFSTGLWQRLKFS